MKNSNKPKRRIKIGFRYHLRNVINSFFFMTLLVCFATTGAISVIRATSANSLPIFVITKDNNELTFFAIILIIFFTVWQLVFTRFIIERPTKEFAKASDKVIHGDYSVRIDMDDLRLGSLEFIDVAENFNIMVEQLGKVDSLSNDFIANVSHELKTPLAVIQSYATILKSPDLTEEERQLYLEKISVSTQQLSTLVANILKLNKIENSQLEPKHDRYNLSSQLSQCLIDFENLWEKKELNISFEVEDDQYIHSDEELMKMVWLNLISNAIKFSPIGAELSIKLIKSGKCIKVLVSDEGCGMTEETKEHIFEKFYQGDTSHSGVGNGLGLALVKKIIDLTNNSIEVESTIGKGATFTVTINEI